MDDLTIQNIFYCTLFLISGVVILRTLRRFRMEVAFYCALFAVVLLSVYIPFYFGGKLMVSFTSTLFRDTGMAEDFLNIMADMLSAPFAVFRFISTGSAIIAFIGTVASLIAVLCIVIRIVHYVRGFRKNTGRGQIINTEREIPVVSYIRNNRNTYKTLLHLRN